MNDNDIGNNNNNNDLTTVTHPMVAVNKWHCNSSNCKWRRRKDDVVVGGT